MGFKELNKIGLWVCGQKDCQLDALDVSAVVENLAKREKNTHAIRVCLRSVENTCTGGGAFHLEALTRGLGTTRMRCYYSIRA